MHPETLESHRRLAEWILSDSLLKRKYPGYREQSKKNKPLFYKWLLKNTEDIEISPFNAKGMFRIVADYNGLPYVCEAYSESQYPFYIGDIWKGDLIFNRDKIREQINSISTICSVRKNSFNSKLLMANYMDLFIFSENKLFVNMADGNKLVINYDEISFVRRTKDFICDCSIRGSIDAFNSFIVGMFDGTFYELGAIYK